MAERIEWQYPVRTFSTGVAELRPAYLPPDHLLAAMLLAVVCWSQPGSQMVQVLAAGSADAPSSGLLGGAVAAIRAL
jgi:hypothetical protein